MSEGVIGVGRSAALGKQCSSNVMVRGGVLTRTSLMVIVFPKTEFSNTISLGGARVPGNNINAVQTKRWLNLLSLQKCMYYYTIT